MKNEEIDCDGTDEIVCPYCGKKHDPDYLELGEEEETDTYICDDCDKIFHYTIYYSDPTFSSETNEKYCNWKIKNAKEREKYWKKRLLKINEKDKIWCEGNINKYTHILKENKENLKINEEKND